MTASTRDGPRERLLRAAHELTYSEGIAVGVDAILQKAGVARRSLYQHFGGKDGLITEVLRNASDAGVRRYQDALDSGGDDPRERLLALFDWLSATTSAPGFRGCRFVAAELALANPDHAAHAEVRAYKRRLHDLFEVELRALGHPDPDWGAEQVLLLVDGVLASALTRRGVEPARVARALVLQVLDAAASPAGPAGRPAG